MPKPKVSINTEGNRGYLTAYPRWTHSLLEIARGAPGRTRFLNGRLWFELTEDNVQYMRTHFDAEPVSDHVREADNMLKASRPPFKTKHPPTEGQKEALRLSAGKGLFAFFEKPGFGKTKLILDHLVRNWCDGSINAALIVAPNFVHEQWVVDEIPKHVHESIPVLATYYRPGKKLKLPEVLEPDPTRLRILTVGYESYVAPKFQPVLEAFLSSAKEGPTLKVAAVLDESHRIKTPRSRISRELNKHANRFSQRYIASGEPTPLGMQDYYAQLRFLSPQILRCYSFAGFKNRYCIMGGFENRQIVGYRDLGHLHERAAPFVHVGEPSLEVEQLYHEWRYDLNPTTRRAYDQMRRDMLIQLENGQLATATNQLVALLRLQEIALGRLVTLAEDGSRGEVHPLPTERPDVLKEIIKGLDGKVIIWNAFVDDMLWQKEHFGERAGLIYGGTPKEDRQQIKDTFLDYNSGMDILVASTAVVGTGQNLQGACRYNIFYSNRDNAGQRWQAERRTFRIGAEKDVHYWDILARNTVDVAVHNRTRRKRQNATMSYDEFKAILEGNL